MAMPLVGEVITIGDSKYIAGELVPLRRDGMRPHLGSLVMAQRVNQDGSIPLLRTGTVRSGPHLVPGSPEYELFLAEQAESRRHPEWRHPAGSPVPPILGELHMQQPATQSYIEIISNDGMRTDLPFESQLCHRIHLLLPHDA